MKIRDGWKKVSLGDISQIYSGGTPSRQNSKYWNGDIPWIKTTQIQNCIINKEDVDELITEEGLKESSAKLIPPTTVVLGMIGQGKTRGQVGYVTFEACTNQNAAAIICGTRSNSSFLFQYLLFNYDNIRALSNSSGQGNLNLGLVKIIPILLPPLPEQKVIAAILETWDRAIEKTEQLIDAKQKRFNALMRKLICDNGKLKIERSAWKKVKLGDVCFAVNRKNNANEKNVLTSSAKHGLVSQLDYYNKSVAGKNLSTYYLLKNGEFAYNRSSAKGYPFGAIKRLDCYKQGVLSTLYLCFAFKKDSKVFSDYLLCLFESGALNRELRAVCQEGARSHGLLNITQHDFFSIRFMLPPFEEQKHIAETLNIAQKEIDLLKKLADKYKTQKRGLMQKLLTGEWRIKPELVKQYVEV